MEFYVVDPKELSYEDWLTRIRSFLKEEGMEYTITDGGLYFLGDDIADPWAESSTLFTIDGEEGGVIEVRGEDKHFYVFADDLEIFEDREVLEGTGYDCQRSGSVFGFHWKNQKSCRFHLGPSNGIHFFVEKDADIPPLMDVEEAWKMFFHAIGWLGGNLSRIQDLKGIQVEKTTLDFVVELSFPHAASVDMLNELLAEEDGYERTRTTLRATFKDRNPGWMRRLVELLPSDEDDFEHALVRAVWRGVDSQGEREIFFVGLERRQLRPFIQLPAHRTSKTLLDKFRAYFKGHRSERLDYSI